MPVAIYQVVLNQQSDLEDHPLPLNLDSWLGTKIVPSASAHFPKERLEELLIHCSSLDIHVIYAIVYAKRWLELNWIGKPCKYDWSVSSVGWDQNWRHFYSNMGNENF